MSRTLAVICPRTLTAARWFARSWDGIPSGIARRIRAQPRNRDREARGWLPDQYADRVLELRSAGRRVTRGAMRLISRGENDGRTGQRPFKR
jgi:hypothetical protein